MENKRDKNIKLKQNNYLLVSFGNTSILVNFLIGCPANLFFALHSYCPESLTKADLIINSDRRLNMKRNETKP